MMAQLTPSQTADPYLGIGLPWPDGPFVVAEGTAGAITITGVVTGGAGEPVPDALVETWQADPDGPFGHPDDPRGRRRPAGPDGGTEAPHIDVSVFARGLLNRVVTRIYFPDEAAANTADPVLWSVEPARVPTLVAVADPDVPGHFRFDIHLQGDHETVFFDV